MRLVQERRRLLLALMMLVVLSVACQDTSHELCLEEIISRDQKDFDLQRVESDEETPYEEWVVFYQGDDSSDKPFGAAVYQLITDRYQGVSDETPSVVAYDLNTICGSPVCQCPCKAERTDLLSAYTGPELVIWGKYDGRSRLCAYRWVTEAMNYELLAYFDGDSIDIEEDRVTVDNNTLGGADLVSRCTYFPREGVRPFTVEEEMSCSQCEIAFPDDVPDDVLTSPYPEMIVLALYNQTQYTDTTGIQPYFAEGIWESIGGWGVEQLGCPVTSSPISHVRVISMSVAEARQIVKVVHHTCSPDQVAAAPDLAIVEVEACCEYMGCSDCEPGASPTLVPVMWVLAWEEDGWRVQAPPTVVEE